MCHAQRSALILRCPAGASKGEGGWHQWPARPSRLRPMGYAPQDEAGERARHQAGERARRACHGTPQRGWQVPRTTISPHPEVPRRGPRRARAGGSGGQPRPSRLRPMGCAPQDEAGERARRACHGTPQRGWQAPRTTISPHPEVPRRGLEGRGRVAPWPARSFMRLERAHSSTNHPEYRTTSPVSRPPIST
ncbi:hypothetical protein GGI59_004509 [Rhizobium lentis]|uniref:Uncharacterized protein n=1 Tax=Rhizobium lentis TaxID=1138194 RepID=A0A7W8XHA0_9HYPH|nr:hypothetical protein [Rhizobium lentis]MBB5552571.1 hypothetical protein [Rhizobium lentis]MBB5562819.1 hypothetical protein [Rhizobium lentis]MBB5569388.1 hypothetical protein [Rhizobium lentis]